jgi:heat-inducible transcriptional repressor
MKHNSTHNLTLREQKILWATVERYIATAEPVGSKVLYQEYNFNISTATIRNILNHLDKSGFLFQPHTSSGRVPSDVGYRVYVDELLPDPSPELLQTSKQTAVQMIPDGYSSLESILRGVAQILASLSGCMALVTAPNRYLLRVHSIQLLPIETRKLMLIVLSDSYHTASTVIDLPRQVNADLLAEELGILHNFLNYHLKGKRWSELATSLQWQELDHHFQSYADLLTTSLQRLTSPQYSSEQIYISGLSELMRQPEFSNPTQLQGIVSFLEAEQASLIPILEVAPPQKVAVQIGSEIAVECLQNCALVSASYCHHHQPVGSVGVLNATRMNYARAIACVAGLAEYLTEVVSQR